MWFVLVVWWDVSRIGFHTGNCMRKGIVDSSNVIPSVSLNLSG